MDTLVEQALSVMFPPSLKSLGEVWPEDPFQFEEMGWAGNVKRKKYRDALERVENEGL